MVQAVVEVVTRVMNGKSKVFYETSVNKYSIIFTEIL
jgi:hypothetical protein